MTRAEHAALLAIFRRIFAGLLSQGEDVEGLAQAVADLKRTLDAAAQQHAAEDAANTSLEQPTGGNDGNQRPV